MSQVSKRKRIVTIKCICRNCGVISYTAVKCKPADFRWLIFALYQDPHKCYRLELDDSTSLFIHDCNVFTIGKNEIISATIEPPSPDDVYTGTICDICGQTVRSAGKGLHIIHAHPEYKIIRKPVNYYIEYRCGFCGFWRTSPAAIVKHIQSEHSNLITT